MTANHQLPILRLKSPLFMNFTPTNELEQALVQAAQDPAARPRFYELLLESQLFVLVPPNTGPHGERMLQKSENVPIMSWKKGEQDMIPMFTSLSLLQQTIGKTGSAVDYLALKGKDLFGLLAAGPLSAVLNPNCPVGKEFFVEEMRDIASGKYFEPTNREVVQKERQVLLGQPAEYPHELVETLKRHLSSQPQVDAAYLAQIADSASGVPPHLIIAIQMHGDIDPVIQRLGLISREILGPGKIVDFTVLGRGGSLDDYFLTKTQPFYQKTSSVNAGKSDSKPFLKRLFGK
jgi:hypothetical protein